MGTGRNGMSIAKLFKYTFAQIDANKAQARKYWHFSSSDIANAAFDNSNSRMSISLQLSHIMSDAPFDFSASDAIRISTRTWNRDSHDLFDYEAQQLCCQEFRLDVRPGDLVRRGNDVLLIPSDEPIPLDTEYIASVYPGKASNGFRLVQNEVQMGKKLWSVVRENWPRGVRVVEGDIIKLGRFMLRVRQLCTSASESDDNTSCSSYNGGTTSSAAAKSPQPEARSLLFPDLRISGRPIIPALTTACAESDPSIRQLQCRICLCEGPCEDDPLVCPCECTGSIRYVHARCLGHWLRGRQGLDAPTSSCALFYRPMACELCHCTYASYFDNKGVPAALCSMPETKTPFVVLENIGGSPLVPAWNSDSSNTFPGGLHVISFQGQDVVKMGRGHDCDMRISDVSISRLHAILRVDDDGAVYLEDHQSKFGTLLDTARGALSIDIGTTPIAVQSGRTVLTVSRVSMADEETALMEDDDQLHTETTQRPHTH